jgi:hypothetical protein
MTPEVCAHALNLVRSNHDTIRPNPKSQRIWRCLAVRASCWLLYPLAKGGFRDMPLLDLIVMIGAQEQKVLGKIWATSCEWHYVVVLANGKATGRTPKAAALAHGSLHLCRERGSLPGATHLKSPLPGRPSSPHRPGRLRSAWWGSATWRRRGSCGPRRRWSPRGARPAAR